MSSQIWRFGKTPLDNFGSAMWLYTSEIKKSDANNKQTIILKNNNNNYNIL